MVSAPSATSGSATAATSRGRPAPPYTLGTADVGHTIDVVASYTDGGGTLESVASNPTATVTHVDHPPTGTVTISGTATQDQVLTASNTLADVDGLGTISYQWQRDGSNVTGATGATYTLGTADVGHTIDVVASYTDGGGTLESVASNPTATVTHVDHPPTGTVTISGTAAQDQVLTASNTLADVDGLGTISYQWQRDGSNVTGATGATYTLGTADVGHTIDVVASYTDGGGTLESVASNPTATVTHVDHPPTGTVTISGTAAQDQVLTASNTLADVDGLGTISYQWQRDGSNVTGATGATYTLGTADVGHTIDVVASYTDGGGTLESVASNPTATVTQFDGIEAVSNGQGNIAVTTAPGDLITSASVGINAYNQASSIPQSGGVTTSSISVTANGTIDSGTMFTSGGSRPAGILAGYKGGTSNTVNPAVYGDVTIYNLANINAAGGDGIRAYNYGSGNVTVTDQSNTTIVAPDVFGISANSYGSGTISVTTAAGVGLTPGSNITSGSSGISAVNLATATVGTGSSVSVTANGTIHSGTHITPGGNQPQGVSAGYFPGNVGASNINVSGTVLLDNFANVTADAGWGLDAFNYGNGSVTLTDEASTVVSGAQYGIGAYSNSSGSGSSGSVTINVGQNAQITTGALYGIAGIQGIESNAGNISITTSAGDTITSGGFGIQANNSSTASATSQILITTNRGSISSGFDTNGGFPAGISAGYNPNNQGLVNSNVLGNVDIYDTANITTASGFGINLYNFSAGYLQATIEPATTVSAPTAGVNAYAQGGGNVTVTNDGTLLASIGSGISAGTGGALATTGNGIISVSNVATGTISAPGAENGSVIQINNDSAQGATFANSGTVTATLLSKTAALGSGSNLNVVLGVNNGSISTDTGNITVTNNNTGTISGNISLATSSFSVPNATFNNAGIWNTNGSNWFGASVNSIGNSGTINMAAIAGFYYAAGGTFTLNNTGNVNVATHSAAYIGGAVTGSGGMFTINDRSELEFGGSVQGQAGPVQGQTVSFALGATGVLTLDNPLTFNGTIANLAIGDTIDFLGGSIVTAASISSTQLSVTINGQVQNYTVSNPLATTINVLSADKIVLASSSNLPINNSPAPYFDNPSAGKTYIFSGDSIVASGTTIGLNIASTDAIAGQFITVNFNQTSSITETGAGVSAANVTTSGANIAFVSAGNISSSTGIGINTSSGAGSTDVIDYANVTGSQYAIDAHTTTGALNIVIGGGATVASSTTVTTSYGIYANTTSSAVVTTTPGTTIDSGSAGILAQDQGVAGTGNSISIFNSASINSGQATGAQLSSVDVPSSTLKGSAGIRAGIQNGTVGGQNPAIMGDVSVENLGNITAKAGSGIYAFNFGSGNVAVSNNASILANGAGPTTAGTGLVQYGIFGFNYGSGSTTVTTGFGSSITSGGSGINAANQWLPTVAGSGGTVTVVALGTISSGANANNSGSAPAGIQAGYNPNGANAFNSIVSGNVLVNDDANITAAAGEGINAYNYAAGNVTVNVGFGVSIQTVTSGIQPAGWAPYGIGASNFGAGNVVVTMSGQDVITSGSTGINAVNEATASAGSLVEVTAAGSIHSGILLTNSNSQPSGISAGYFGGAGSSATPNANINGTVIVNNSANITAAAGWGINAYNYGNGDVTVNDASGTTISGAQYGIEAAAESGGTGNIAVNVYSGVTINATSSYGILAFSTDVGNISVITASGDTINAGSVGINAVNEAAAIPPLASSSIVVTAYGTINSGTALTGTGSPPAGITAGYLGGGVIPTTFPLAAINGDVVVNNFANINAAAGDGIRAFTFGIGDVTINDEAGSIRLGVGASTAGYEAGINASNDGSGNIDISTAVGILIDSTNGGSGIMALNKAPAPWPGSTFSVPASSHVSVLAYGSIESGSVLTGSNDPAAGILAGYNPNNTDTADDNVHGNVSIDDYANILAVAGTDGIRAVNYGTGTIAIIAEAGASITAGRYGIGAFGYDGGDVSVTNNAYVTGATAAIDALATSAGAVSIDNYGMITGNVFNSGDATFHNEAGAVWNLAGSSTFTGTSELINDGAIDTTGTSGIVTSGVLSLANTGVVEVQSGSLDVAAVVTGLGSFTIDSGSLLEFATSVAAGSVVAFEGTAATLKLDNVAQFGGSVTGFTSGDTIDLVGISPANVSVSNPGSLQIGYGTGSIALGGNYNPADFTIGTDGQGGTDATWNHQAPVISTSGLTVTQNGNGTSTITGLQVSDSDAAASTETFTMTATTGAAGSGTGVSPSTGSGLLTAINSELGTGITYNPGATPPSTDKVALTVTDGFGATDTVNFVFNLASSPTTPVTVMGTSGKDVIFATGNNDALTGGGGTDQFVFNKTTGAHTITDFSTINDHIDLTALSSIVTAGTINAWLASNVAPSSINPADTVISLGGTETITLHNVLATNVHASDFIVHA